MTKTAKEMQREERVRFATYFESAAPKTAFELIEKIAHFKRGDEASHLWMWKLKQGDKETNMECNVDDLRNMKTAIERAIEFCERYRCV